MEAVGSNKTLWILISGTSLTSKELIGTELQANLKKISNGLNFYLPPNPKSAKELQNDTKVDEKICQIVFQLSKFMNLDERQCYEVFCDFLLYEYRGSDASLQVVVGNDRLMQNFMLQIWEYYRSERLYLLLSLKEILCHYNTQHHPYHDLFNEFVTLVDEHNALRNSLLNQWECLLKVTVSISKMQTSSLSDKQTRSWMSFTLREQCELLQLMFVYYKEDTCDADMFLKLLTSIQDHGFGWRQLSIYSLDDDSSQPLLQSIAYLECLILLRILNLPSIRNEVKCQSYFLADNERIWKKIDRVMCHLGTQNEHGPLMLAWAVVRYRVLKDDALEVTRSLGMAALELGAINFLNLILLNPIFQGTGTVGGCAKSVIYSLLSTLLTQFNENSLGPQVVIYEVAQKLLEDPEVAFDFWEQGTENGLGMLFTSATRLFPYSFCPLVDLMSSLAEASSSSSAKVVEYFRELPYLTLIQKPNVPYKELWNKNGRPLQIYENYHPYDTDTISLLAGTVGNILIDDKENSVVQWQQPVNGWQLSLAVVNQILREISLGSGFVTVKNLDVINSFTALVKNLIRTDTNMFPLLEYLIRHIFLVLQRILQLRQPAVSVIASCLNLAAAVEKDAEMAFMWSNVVQCGILPQGLSSFTSLSQFADVEFNQGPISFLITSCECVSGDYQVTLSFLNLLSSFATFLVNRDDPTFSTSVAFVAREIFPSHSRWWYHNPDQREQIAQKCLSIFHRVLQAPSSASKHSSNKLLLSGVTLSYLVQQESSHTLLNMICTGEEAINQALKRQVSWISGHGIELLNTVKLALSVLSRLLVLWRDGAKEHSPLVSALCSDPHAIRTVANYVYHSFDIRLATLGIFLMKRFARELPISLLVCLGPDASTFCKLLLLRLESRTEDINLKIAILEFLSACVESQPGMTEAFIGNLQDNGSSQENMQFVPTSKCLRLVVDILRHYNQEPSLPEDLRNSALLFLRSLWIGRQTLALNDLKACPDLWNILIEPILENGVAAHLKASEFTITILAQEFLLLKLSCRSPSERFIGLLNKLSSGSTILDWTKSVCDKSKHDGESEESSVTPLSSSLMGHKNGIEGLLRSWKDFLVVGAKTKLLTLPLPQKIINTAIDALIFRFNLGFNDGSLNCLSEIVLHLSRLWPRTDCSFIEKMECCFNTLNSMTVASNSVQAKVIANILTFCVIEVSSAPEKVSVDQIASAFLSSVCEITQYSALTVEKLLDRNCSTSTEIQFQIMILCATLLQKLTSICNDCDIWMFHIHKSSLFASLLNLLSSCLKKCEAPEVCCAILQLLLSLSDSDAACAKLLSVGIVETLCLPLAKVGMFGGGEAVNQIRNSRDKAQWNGVYVIACNLIACILHNQRHFALESVLNFSNVHLFVFEMVPFQFQQKLSLEIISMATAILQLIHELSRFSSSWKIRSMSSRPTLLKIVSTICYISIAYLLRPQLIRISVGRNKDDCHNANLLKNDNHALLRRMSSTEELDKSDPTVADAFKKLLHLSYLCVSTLCNFSPDLCEFLSEPGYDIGQWDQLIEVGFVTPSIDQLTSISFGTIISSASICLRILSGSDRSSPPASNTLSESAMSHRHLATSLLEKSLYLVLSQASIIIFNTHQPTWDKQLFKRELGSELDPFVQSRFLKRGSNAQSPVPSLMGIAPISPRQRSASLAADKWPFICLILALVQILFK